MSMRWLFILRLWPPLDICPQSVAPDMAQGDQPQSFQGHKLNRLALCEQLSARHAVTWYVSTTAANMSDVRGREHMYEPEACRGSPEGFRLPFVAW